MRNSLATVIIAVLTGLSSQTLSQSPEADAARDWFIQVRQQAYEAVMPLAVPDMLVIYRASHPMMPASFERYFAIQYVRVGVGFNANLLKATVVIPTGHSIQDQLIQQRMKDREASLTDLLKRLALRKGTLYVDSCEVIRVQMDGLSQVRVAIPKRDIVTLDARVHEFAVELPNLRMKATIEDDNAALVNWAGRTHERLLRCLPTR